MDRPFERVEKIIVDLLGVERDKVTLDACFREDLGADSLNLVELIMEFEEDFGWTISDEDAQNIRTVGDVVEYIQAHLSPKDREDTPHHVPAHAREDGGHSRLSPKDREDTLDLDREYLLG